MVSLRKINTIFVLLIILLLLAHAVLSVLLFYGLIKFTPSIIITGQLLVVPLVGHIILSLYLYHKKVNKSVKRYPKLTSETSLQMISGLAIIVFVILHILANMMLPVHIYSGFYFKLMHFLIDIFLFISIAAHLRVSIPRFLVSLGFLKGKGAYKKFKYRFNIFNYIWLAIAIFAEVVCYCILM